MLPPLFRPVWRLVKSNSYLVPHILSDAGILHVENEITIREHLPAFTLRWTRGEKRLAVGRCRLLSVNIARNCHWQRAMREDNALHQNVRL